MLDKNKETIVVTGAAGFIGYHVAKKLLEMGKNVIGIDNMNDYYDVKLKEDKLNLLLKTPYFKFYKDDIADAAAMDLIFSENKVDKICHLAAQAGVRYSLERPYAYERRNVLGTLVLLETARNYDIKHFVFASSSSIYGNRKAVPFKETDVVDKPISLYAATKKSNELMAYTYHHLFNIHMIGLRFFTVYGPWGRPDMAPFIFTKAISEEKPIKVFNNGEMYRDFTYVDDITEGVVKAIEKSDEFDYEIFNLGCSEPVKLTYFIECIEKSLGKKAEKKMMPMQPGDVEKTYADITKAKKLLGYEPKTKIDEGVKKFVEWYKDYYKINDKEEKNEEK